MAPSEAPKPTARVFISYSSEDFALAESTTSRISGDGVICFYAPSDIEAREKWRDRLESEILAADVVLLLLTAHAGDSDWVYFEIDRAHRLGKDIWVMQQRGVRISARFEKFELGARYQSFLFDSTDQAAVLERVIRLIDEKFGRREPPPAGTINESNNPYPLTAYQYRDREFFFGRDAECNQLLADIYDCDERVFFVYGPSGAGKSSLIDAGLRPLISQRWWFSEKIEPPVDPRQLTNVDLWRFAERQLRPERQIDPNSPVIRDIVQAIKDLNRPGYLFWFDHTERLIAAESAFQQKTFMGDFFRTTAELLNQSHRVRVIISFRQEVLAQVEDRAKGLPRGSWRKWLLRRMSPRGAQDSVIRTARVRTDVLIEKDLAGALVDLLKREEFQDYAGNRIETVNPVSLQLVCRRLWSCGKPGFSRITLHDLTDGKRPLDPKGFVEVALKNHLDEAIEKIAKSLGHENVEEKKELIKLGLLQFVSDDQRRQQLKEEPDHRVGRLEHEIIESLYEEKLLQRTDVGLIAPDYRFELVHDSLAEAIYQFRDRVKLLQTLTTLESTIRTVKGSEGLPGYFNRHTDLLAELEQSRKEKTGFFDEEKEFLFRCALGNRRTLTSKPISLQGWTRLLLTGRDSPGNAGRERHEEGPKAFVRVLKEALAGDVTDESVRRDAIDLLVNQEIRGYLLTEELNELGLLVLQSALESPPDVQEAACRAVCRIREPLGAADLFALLKDRTRIDKARLAVGWVRHAADRREIDNAEASDAFESLWRREKLIPRLRILGQVWFHRTTQSFGWMFFAVIMATLFTAIGAAIAFVPMGFLGASLTLADKSAGWGKGPFHGAAGGTFWGAGISVSLMLYWVVLKGGMVSPKIRKWIPAMLAAALGGFIAGIALALVILFVFQSQSLYSAGWLQTSMQSSYRAMLMDIFVYTRHGWWTPILGAAVGVGVSWSLQTVAADKRAETFLGEQSRAIHRPSEAIRAIAKILHLVIRRSWRILLALVIGGLLVYPILLPGPGICDKSDPQWNQWKKTPKAPVHCEEAESLAPKYGRIGGIVIIMWAGGTFLASGVLFGIFVARTGVRLSQDDKFLKAFPD